MTGIKKTSDEMSKKLQFDTISAESPELQDPVNKNMDVGQKTKSKKLKKKFDVDHYIIKTTAYFHILKRIPFVLIGDKIKAKRANYRNLQKQLNQARIPISHEMYISNAVFYSIVAGIVGAIIGLFLTYTAIVLVGLPDQITNSPSAPAWHSFCNIKKYSLLFSLL
ncbi:hypothetical protein V7O67_09035 [Methanolobus sp. ZRKC4]|uniref:hypothetical protein n=1 Tax=Methanolobus sp. ZRKC4 TaxID=3125787 RepID=UPI00324B9645